MMTRLAKITMIGFTIALALCATVILVVPAHRIQAAAQVIFNPNPAPPGTETDPFAEADPWAAKLIKAAESQIGRTVHYDGSYQKLRYPFGDVPIERGVCSDVVVRAYRDAFSVDLQQLLHEDMQRHFSAYPKRWSLKRPDSNIDHRRVLNLATYFRRKQFALPITTDAADYLPGDIVTQTLPGNLPHIAIVTHRANGDGSRPLVIHNIGAGTRLEDSLFAYEITGHYRFRPVRSE